MKFLTYSLRASTGEGDEAEEKGKLESHCCETS
jgi:hypothetical protein